MLLPVPSSPPLDPELLAHLRAAHLPVMLVHGRCAERMWVCIDCPDHWVPKKQALWQTLLLF